MPSPEELKNKFWKSLRSDMTIMVGLTGELGHTRPLTAQFQDTADAGPIWFFTSKETALVEALGQGHRATAAFASKDHELFASVQGQLSLDNDPAVIDVLWNPYVAAWYEGDKHDPKLALLRFDAENAEIWENASSLLAGIKLLLGTDPKRDYRDKVAKVVLK